MREGEIDSGGSKYRDTEQEGPLSNLSSSLISSVVCTRQLTGVMSFPTVNSVSLDPEARKVKHYYLSSTQVDRDFVKEGNREILAEETKTVMVGLTLSLYTLTGSRTFIFNQKLKVSLA